MTMIERVARAIAQADTTVNGQFDDTEMGDIFWGEWKHLYIPMARAAIEAMREPTDAMVDAMDEHAGTIAPQYAYEAAIDAALNEQVSG